MVFVVDQKHTFMDKDYFNMLQGGVIMAKCEICNKGQHFGIQISHSHRRSNRAWKPNIRKVRLVVNGAKKSMNVCAKCLRSSKLEKTV
jgi:large subunit ribosomal protein L28